MISTSTITIPSPPASFRKISECPHCGAPIYADASLVTKDDTLAVLPMPYYTCGCRFNLPVVSVPYPVPMTPHPDTIPFTPPFGTTWGKGDNEFNDGHTTCVDRGAAWWKQFNGSGSLTAQPDPRVVCVY